MIIVNLKDRLGNQMFQYALGYVLAKRNNSQLCLDLRTLNEEPKNLPKNWVTRTYDLDIFGIIPKKPKFIDLLKTFQFNKRYVIRFHIADFLDRLGYITILDRTRLFDPRILYRKEKTLYLDGYWQTEKYFLEFRNEILDIYNFNSIENEKHNIEFVNKINNQSSVCLNVRRTDHLNDTELDVVNMYYYNNAISYCYKSIDSNLHFFVSSDDLDWCKKNFKHIPNITFVEHDKYAGNKFYNYLYLMSKFKNYIIPNSTFAWWAVWLSKEKNKKVLVPKKWSGIDAETDIDAVLKEWIRIDN
jgi:hypothetical protein